MARATPLRPGMGGRLTSRKSKTGNPECSRAMSAWVRARHAGIQVAGEVFKILGKCRSQARMLSGAANQANAGNELRAQVLRARAARGLTMKERAAKAAELRARRVMRPTPAQATPSLREQADAHRARGGLTPERRAEIAARIRNVDRPRDLARRVNDLSFAVARERDEYYRMQTPGGRIRKGLESQAKEAAAVIARDQEKGKRLLARAVSHGARDQIYDRVSVFSRPLPNQKTVSAAQAANRSLDHRLSRQNREAQVASARAGKGLNAAERLAKAIELKSQRAVKAPKPLPTGQTAARNPASVAERRHRVLEAGRLRRIRETLRNRDRRDYSRFATGKVKSVLEAVHGREAKPLHTQAMEAAERVPIEKRYGNKVFLHHAWQEYRKQGGKLGLDAFKTGLMQSVEGRMMTARADLVQAMRRGDVKASTAHYMGTEKNFIKTSREGTGTKLKPRPESEYHRKAAASVGPATADLVARVRAAKAKDSLPARTADTMSDSIAMSSPSGRMSARARSKATKALGEKLFGPGGLPHPTASQPTKKETLLRQAKELRDLAARGMKPKAYLKKAEELEAQASPSSSPSPKAAAAETTEPKFTLGQPKPPRKQGAGFENSGKGKTAFLFDMKKGDLPGQTSLMDRVPILDTKTGQVVSKPSLRDQAAAHRATKGAPQERIARALARAEKRLNTLGYRNSLANSEADRQRAIFRTSQSGYSPLSGKAEAAQNKAAATKAALAAYTKPQSLRLAKDLAERFAKEQPGSERWAHAMDIYRKHKIRNGKLVPSSLDTKKDDLPGQVVSTQKARMAAAVKAVSKSTGKPVKDLGAAIKHARTQAFLANERGDVVSRHHWKQHQAALEAHKAGGHAKKTGGWNLPAADTAARTAAVVARARAKGSQRTSTKRLDPGDKIEMLHRVPPKEAMKDRRDKTAAALKDFRGKLNRYTNVAEHGKPGDTGYVPTKAVHFDPDRFQFKQSAQGKHGVTDQFAETKKWNPELAGVISAWRDPKNGKLYVVNGHHRLDLANRLGVKDVRVQLLNARDASEARAKGAIENIGEGRGTAYDAGRFLREHGITKAGALEEHGVSLSEHTAKRGLDLAGLHPSLWRRYEGGEIPEERAAMIGGSGLSHAQQEGLMASVKKGTNNSTLRELIANAHASGNVKKQTRDLFGTSEEEVSLAHHRASVQAHVRDAILADKRLYGLVSKSKAAQSIEEREAGRIHQGKAGEISQQSRELLAAYDQLKNRGGPVAAALSQAEQDLHEGHDKREVFTRTRKRVIEALGRMLQGGKESFAA